MQIIVEFGLLGVATGAIYALAALGIVIVYRGSGVINFAAGAIGITGVYLYYELHDVLRWDFIAALIPSLMVCALIGAIVQLLVMQHLRKASALTRVLATIGVLLVLQSALQLRYPEPLLVVQSSLPIRPVRVFGAIVGEDRLWILGITILLSIGLAVIYRFSAFGRATSAIAENSNAAEALGYSPNVIAGANWAIGSTLSGLAMILIVPITGLEIGLATAIVIPALAAAVAGRLSSFSLAVVSGLAIGIIQSEMGYYIHFSGWSAAVPFFVILIVLALRGTKILGRSETTAKLPRVGTGRVRPTLVVSAIVAAILLCLELPLTWINGFTTTLSFGLILLSLVLVTGYAGQLSLVQLGLAGIGALVAADMVANQHLPFILAIFVGMIATVPVGVVVGLPSLRTRGPMLAVATLGLGVAIENLIFDSAWLTGGYNGIAVAPQRVFGIDISTVSEPRNYALFCLVAFVITAFSLVGIRRSRIGRRLLAVRANERAAAALGVNTVGCKLFAFASGGAIAALGGILLSFQGQTVLFGTFAAFNSVNLVGLGVVGGVGYLIGPIYGAQLEPGAISTNIGDLFGSGIQSWLPLAGGILLILILIASPDGIADQNARDANRVLALLRRVFRRPEKPHHEDFKPTGAIRARVTPRSLDVKGLSVHFGGVRALSDVSISISPGQVIGLIGPNGAGKTTLIDAITGLVTPSSGVMSLAGVDLKAKSAPKRYSMGIARSFQSLELFEDMTVRENLLIGSELPSVLSTLRDYVKPGRARLSDAAVAATRDFRLEDLLDEFPPNLSYGNRRMVAIARTIASEPSILLLDEPAAGLDESERAELSALIRELVESRGMGVLLVEHDVDLVMRTADEILVLNFGEEIGRGTPDNIRNDPRVIEAYLGGVSGSVPV